MGHAEIEPRDELLFVAKKIMADIFSKFDARKVLKKKKILFLGDLIMRNVYKDLIWLLSEGNFTPQDLLKRKGENSFGGDRLTFKSSDSFRRYREEREYIDKDRNIELYFTFITRCCINIQGIRGHCVDKECAHNYLERLLQNFKESHQKFPDVVLINSFIWDVQHWGSRGPENYKFSVDLCKWFKNNTDTQVIWMTTPPISDKIRGGTMVEQLKFLQEYMRPWLLEANLKASNIVGQYGFDVLDMHYYMSSQIQRRAEDGLHWNPDGVRYQTNVFLTHFCLSRQIDLPGNIKIKNLDGSINNGILMEAQKIAQSVFDESYENDPKNEHDNN